MSSKKTQTEYYSTLGRRRKSFFEFTDSYPGALDGKKIRNSDAYKKKERIARTLIAIGVIILIIIGFFVTDLLMNVSELPVSNVTI